MSTEPPSLRGHFHGVVTIGTTITLGTLAITLSSFAGLEASILAGALNSPHGHSRFLNPQLIFAQDAVAMVAGIICGVACIMRLMGRRSPRWTIVGLVLAGLFFLVSMLLPTPCVIIC